MPGRVSQRRELIRWFEGHGEEFQPLAAGLPGQQAEGNAGQERHVETDGREARRRGGQILGGRPSSRRTGRPLARRPRRFLPRSGAFARASADPPRMVDAAASHERCRCGCASPTRRQDRTRSGGGAVNFGFDRKPGRVTNCRQEAASAIVGHHLRDDIEHPPIVEATTCGSGAGRSRLRSRGPGSQLVNNTPGIGLE